MPTNPLALGQSTPSMQLVYAQYGRVGGRVSAARRRKKKRARVRSSSRARVTSRRRRGAPRSRKRARLVKGSAAARRHMAKLRRMRKR